MEEARKAFSKGNTGEGSRAVGAFEREVAERRGQELIASHADGLLGQAGLVQNCVLDCDLAATVTALAGWWTAWRTGLTS